MTVATLEKKVDRLIALVEKFLAPPVEKPLWQSDWRNAPTDGGFYIQEKEPGRATLVPGRFGKAVRLHTKPGDNNVAGSGELERCDLSLPQNFTDGYEGSEHWFAHSIYLPDDFDIPPKSVLATPTTPATWNWAAIFGWHHTGATGQGNHTIFVFPETATSPDRPTGITYRGYGGEQDQGEYKGLICPTVKNAWLDFVHHIRWSSVTDGFFESWLNGRKYLSHKGQTLYKGQGCYLKPALYHSANGKSSSVIHERIVRGKTAASVSLGPLE